MDQEKIGKFISQLRKEKNISQEALAKQLFISRQAISKWESGKTLPDGYNLQKLAKIFNVSVNELLVGEYINKESNQSIVNFQLNIYNEIVLMRKTIFVLIIIVLCFIICYFAFSYNYIKVLTLNEHSDSIKIDNGFNIVNKEKINLILEKNKKDNIKSLVLIYIGKYDKSYTIYYCEDYIDITLNDTKK